MAKRTKKDADGDGKTDEAAKDEASAESGPIDADGDGKVNEDDDPPRIANARRKVARELTAYQKAKKRAKAAADTAAEADADESDARDRSDNLDDEYSEAVRELERHVAEHGEDNDTARELNAIALDLEKQATAAEKEWQAVNKKWHKAQSKLEPADEQLTESRYRLNDALENYYQAHVKTSEPYSTRAEELAGEVEGRRDELQNAERDLEIDRKHLDPDDPDEVRAVERQARLVEIKREKLARLEEEHAAAKAVADRWEKRTDEAAVLTRNDENAARPKEEDLSDDPWADSFEEKSAYEITGMVPGDDDGDSPRVRRARERLQTALDRYEARPTGTNEDKLHIALDEYNNCYIRDELDAEEKRDNAQYDLDEDPDNQKAKKRLDEAEAVFQEKTRIREERTEGLDDALNSDNVEDRVRAAREHTAPLRKKKEAVAEKEKPAPEEPAEAIDAGEAIDPKAIVTGPKGGRYYIAESGEKVYVE